MDNQTQKKSGCGVLIIIIVAIILLLGLIGSNDSSSKSRYSSDYNNNKSYRDNVDSAAEAFGKSSYEVDRAIQAVAGQ